ncbi:hypothetical protein N7470_005580 [Penicillium chermesinum]|nr:hypothetical protein N7470_005580 [Penicillium chermesinum]
MLQLQDRSLAIFVVTVVFLGISSITVCLRCFVRLKIVKAFGWDDGLMVFAWILNIFFALCGITGALRGFGQRKEVLLREGRLETAMFWWWLGQTSYVWVCGVAKSSIAVTLLRLTVSRVHTVILSAVIAVTVVVGLVFCVTPVSFFWQRVRPGAEGRCFDPDNIINIAYVYSVSAACCDLTLGLLPVFLVWNLQMNTRSKTALAGILGIGCVASAAVIVRIPYLHDYKSDDFLYTSANISIWSNVEAGLGIAAGSLVTLRPLFRWFRDPSSAGSRSKRTADMPLHSVNLRRSGGRSGSKYWRSDIDDVDTLAVVTASPQGSGNSSQENLNPKQEPYLGGVHVQKSFFISEHQP